MVSDLKFPYVYKRGVGVISEIGEYCKTIAKRVVIIGGKKALASVQEKLVESLEKASVQVIAVKWFGGECTWQNINRLTEFVQSSAADLIIAVGGGKALDTGKAVSFNCKIPCVTVPTIAATCAAYTPLSIIHNEHGVYVQNSSDSACPIGVFLDSQIIVEAPVKWFYSGMGDTLAKWYELRATTCKVAKTSWTIGGFDNGSMCYQIIKQFGPNAKKAIESKKVNDSFEYVLDAIVFYAGMSSILGGDKFRGAAAHSVYMGFTNIPSAHSFGHGLLVGFGNLCLLALEGRSEEEIIPEMKLAKDCGVPVMLSEIADLSEEDIHIVATTAIKTNGIRNMPMKVTPEMIVESIKLVDRLGQTNFTN